MQPLLKLLALGLTLIAASCSTSSPVAISEEQAAPSIPVSETPQPQTENVPVRSRVRVNFPVANFLTFPKPNEAALEGEPLTLWATNYYTPVYQSGDQGIPLLDTTNTPISGKLTRKQWCNAALQGSVSVSDPDGEVKAYVFADQDGPEQIDCDDQLGNLSEGIKRATRRIRFAAVDHPFGCGVRNWRLIPYRTIAVDTNLIPFETVLYIEALAGKTFEIDGRKITHDGLVFAADKGGAIKGNHIDFFSGIDRKVPFTDVITSTPEKTITARILRASHSAARFLKREHNRPCSED